MRPADGLPPIMGVFVFFPADGLPPIMGVFVFFVFVFFGGTGQFASMKRPLAWCVLSV
ncbi:hypothetical protein L6Q96_18195 [Candidatus Binatia bacterium]|nr:hypothetical protein [Candidatus Binatia bacterium]